MRVAWQAMRRPAKAFAIKLKAMPNNAEQKCEVSPMTRKTKKDYIEAAYALIVKEGIEHVTIRQVADEVGSSSASLYRHFDNLDHLLALASVRFLRSYSNDASYIAQVDLNPMELELELWECFAYYAFKDVPIFENLFFGGDSDRTQHIILEYYYNFPEELSHVRPYITEMMSEGNLIMRDRYVLTQAVKSGMITEESCMRLSKIATYLLRGMLQAYRETYQVEGVARRAMIEFMDLMRSLYLSALLPGHTILIRDAKFRYDKRSTEGDIDASSFTPEGSDTSAI